MLTKRQESIKWWISLSDLEKILWLPHLGGIVGIDPLSLTVKQIEKIFDAKCKEDDEFIEMAFSENKGNKGTQRNPFGIGS